jgi:O-antigen ligase
MSKSENSSLLSSWLDRFIIFWLFAFALCAPHSIAATQTAWLLGMLLWVIRFFVYPPPKLHRTPVDYALLGFFILTGLSSLFSYEPMVSIGKLRAASLFTIVYLFCENIPSLRIVRLLALTLIASCMVNVVYEAGARVIGRGVKVRGVSAESPLSSATFLWAGGIRSQPVLSGDTILEIDGQVARDPEQLASTLYARPGLSSTRLKIYRAEWVLTVMVPRGRLLSGATAEQQLGIGGWSRGRDWRATGFYGHWVTYAEVLQLIASLALGLLICVPQKRSRPGGLLLLAVAGLCFALLLTVTRASWLGFLVSATVMVLVGTSRRTILLLAACALPILLAGFFLLHQRRNVGFIDRSDPSTTWRETVWREGANLLISKPRHLVIGVGMDSLKAHWREWGLFDNGRIPIGHMHSDLLQLALERGVPALILWLILLGVYARTLWRLLLPERTATTQNSTEKYWLDRGIALGALGGLAGFFTSGLVHYNWGDSEVVMIFYLIMGLILAIERQAQLPNAAGGNLPLRSGS